jgi:capsular polysaccharide biosynthesis protein
LAILKELPEDTGIIVPSKLKPIHWETLDLLGLRPKCRPTSETHLRVEKYHFSAPTSMIDCYNPYGIQWMRKSFLPLADPMYQGPKKFFFARTGKRRAIENIGEITKILTHHGWSIVCDMDLTFAQTIRLFSQASEICGFLGSNMSNVIFCPPGCRVLHWVPDNFLDSWVDLMAPVLQLDYRSIILRSGGPQAHKICLDPQEIRAGLCAWEA